MLAGAAALPRLAWAQSGEEAAVNDAIDSLTKAMMAADKGKLEELVADRQPVQRRVAPLHAAAARR